jgi:hypothetical protein
MTPLPLSEKDQQDYKTTGKIKAAWSGEFVLRPTTQEWKLTILIRVPSLKQQTLTTNQTQKFAVKIEDKCLHKKAYSSL